MYSKKPDKGRIRSTACRTLRHGRRVLAGLILMALLENLRRSGQA
jgi:hypothetical protein